MGSVNRFLCRVDSVSINVSLFRGNLLLREALKGEEVINDVALVGISNSFSFSGLTTVTSSSARELGRSVRGFCVQKVILGALFLF